MPIIPTLKRLRKVDCKLKNKSLGYIGEPASKKVFLVGCATLSELPAHSVKQEEVTLRRERICQL
jgi:hypothetical protein